MDSGLLEKSHGAAVVRCVVRGFRCYDQNRNFLKVGKLPGRVFLQPAFAKLRRLGLFLLLDLQIRSACCWRRINEGIGGDAPRPCKRCAVTGTIPAHRRLERRKTVVRSARPLQLPSRGPASHRPLAIQTLQLASASARLRDRSWSAVR